MSKDVHSEYRDRSLQMGEQVGDYVIEELIGSGSFGVVYRAIHPDIGKPVAVKVLAHRFSSDPAVLSRFILEARAVNQIQHLNIIDIFTFGQLPDGRHYHVMELLTGRSLSDYLMERGGRLALEDALPILRGVARALDAAHTSGIVHRDLKPANVFISSDEDQRPFPKLLDFGIAKLLHNQVPKSHQTATGAAVGTPDYMSPEQCRGKEIDHRSDIYAFGLLAFRLLTGRLPFESDSVIESMMNHLTKTPANFSKFNGEFGDCLDDMFKVVLAKDAKDRPATARRFVAQLEEAIRAAGVALSTQRSSLESDLELARTAELQLYSGLQNATPSTGVKRWRWLPALLLLVGGITIAGIYAGIFGGEVTGIAPAGPRETSTGTSTSTEVPHSLEPEAGDNASDDGNQPTVPPKVSIHFEGEPKGAEIYDTNGMVFWGRVPVTIQIPQSEDRIKFVVRASGFQSRTAYVRADRDTSISIQLKKNRETAPVNPDALEIPEW